MPLQTKVINPKYKAPVAKPAAPTVDQYLTNDTTYQSQMAALLKAMGNYQAQSLAAQTNYDANAASQRADLQDQQRVATTNNNEDYGSRGMLHSGLFAVSAGDLSNNYARRFSDLDMARQQYLQGLQRDTGNFTEQNNLAKQQALQDAINRRALGLIGNSPTAVK